MPFTSYIPSLQGLAETDSTETFVEQEHCRNLIRCPSYYHQMTIVEAEPQIMTVNQPRLPSQSIQVAQVTEHHVKD